VKAVVVKARLRLEKDSVNPELPVDHQFPVVVKVTLQNKRESKTLLNLKPNLKPKDNKGYNKVLNEPHKVKPMLNKPQVVVKAGAKEAPKEAVRVQAEAVNPQVVAKVVVLEKVEAEKALVKAAKAVKEKVLVLVKMEKEMVGAKENLLIQEVLLMLMVTVMALETQ
jgi:hypothetical protein